MARLRYKIFPVQAIKGWRVSAGIAPLVRILGIWTETSGQLQAPAALSPGISPQFFYKFYKGL